VPDAYICDQMCNSPIRGGILAAECGMGKTNTYLAAVYIDVRRQEEEAKQGARKEFFPNIIIVPSHLVHQVFQECSTNFKGLLEAWVYYSTSDRTRDKAQASRVISREDFAAKAAEWCRNKGSPKVSRCRLDTGAPGAAG
jgi:hypothetical protein